MTNSIETVLLNEALDLAEIAYLARPAAEIRLNQSGWTILDSIQPNDFGWIATKNNQTVILFRGTETLKEWLNDFTIFFLPNPFGPGWIHKGFRDRYFSVRDSVIKSLAKNPFNENIFVGHSLGGALAILCAADDKTTGSTVYTFGGPRVGNSIFRDWLDSRIGTYRMVNKYDIVPHQPNSLHLYFHVGMGCFVDGGYTEDIHIAHNLQLSYSVGLTKLGPMAKLEKVS